MTARTVGRITNRTAFTELQRSRSRGSSGPVRALFAPADESTPGLFPQVGYAIGRPCGSAVIRNRLRRRAREVVRVEAPTLPKGSFLVRLEQGAADLSPAEFRADVATALRRAGRTPRARRAPEGGG
ncbi:MAG TPA: ribonuclease P protein component [Acidimicrobiales bacterium]|nr:ribonuclease P protein component [Acidimicrobiales bacterium]